METFSFEELFHLLDQNKLKELRAELMEMNVVDIAEFIDELEGKRIALVFRILPNNAFHEQRNVRAKSFFTSSAVTGVSSTTS
ncbi:MAG: hypothetical protein II784_00415, partial [Oscillospiraceae bacterium]|nr:hypothetical protein [Oscillospiraceae bacterium]